MASILLIDDEPDILTIWRMILTHEGYEVRCAYNGVEAFEQIRLHVPDLIVTDWMMPRMGGAEFCRLLKSQPQLARIPVIVHSATPLQKNHGLWNAHLRKPVPMQLLLTTIGRLCAKSG